MAEETQTVRILDMDDNEITKEEADTELGYLYPDSIVKEHHDEVKAVSEVGHYYPETFYFENGDPYTVQGEEEDVDPHVGKTDKEGVFTFIAQTPEEASLQVRGVDVKWIIDTPAVEYKAAYDDYESIQRYRKYTEEELAERKKAKEVQEKQTKFMTEGPDQLASNTSSIDDLTVMISEMVGI